MFRKIAVLHLLAPPLASAAQAPHIPTQIPGRNALLMGADWYPEQWPESRWETDVAIMEAAHFTVVRIAESTGARFPFPWAHTIRD